MVKKIVIAIIIILMILPAGTAIIPLSLASEEIEAYGVAGLMAYLPVSKEEDEDEDIKPESCACNKLTGKISYDGGTSFTDCPCTGSSNCGCKKTTSAAPEPAEVYPRTIVITEWESCVWCRNLDEKVFSKLRNDAHKKAGWRVGKGRKNHVQIIDLDDPDSEQEIKDLNLSYDGLPTMFFIESNGNKKFHAGSMSYSQFITWAKPTVKKK